MTIERRVIKEYRHVHYTDKDGIESLLRDGWEPYTDLAGTHHGEYISFRQPSRPYLQRLPGQGKKVVFGY